MLFQRRAPQPFWNKVGNIIWPKMGVKRLWNYYKHRTVRIPASEHSIAAGVAFGCAVSWTPTFGTHLLQCALFSWVFRANWIASFIGSALGNPWTTPLMMLIAYHVGKALFVATGYVDIITPDDGAANFTIFFKSIIEGDITLKAFKDNFMEYFMPTLLGGYVMALATYPIFYYPVYYMVKGARVARKARIQRIVHQEAIEVTGQIK